MRIVIFFITLIFILNISCYATENNRNTQSSISEGQKQKKLTLAIERKLEYLPFLRKKTVALVVNQTSSTKNIHLVDLLLEENIHIKTIFAPEHGFRGKADAGEKISNGIDVKTGLPIISLYGKHKKPTVEDLEGIDVVVFDIQDVGARFYTYISTLHYIMDACAENKIKLIVLDRPNPNGHFVDGQVLDLEFQSFVGMHPIPTVHGMTIAEYAKMINGEKWLKNGIQCNLDYVKCLNYNRKTIYELPIKPSPNLPNSKAINLYPSICFLEGTNVSIGRGTEFPFQVIGSPTTLKEATVFSFIPKTTSGAKYPKHENIECYGFDLRTQKILKSLDLSFLIEMYKLSTDKKSFFLKNNFIDLLAGTDKLRKDIIAGKTAKEIKESWEPELSEFKKIRKKYLLY